MSKQRHPQVVNVDEVPSTELSYGQRFRPTRKQLGMAALVAKIEFSEWTPDGHLRHSKFVGLREDKEARGRYQK
jgi:bifunctional non-homologous end joining protein LigD